MTTVQGYFETLLTSLNYVKWNDAFNQENIPNTIINKHYFLDLKTLTNIKQNQSVIDATWNIDINIFTKGYKDTQKGKENAIIECEKIIKKACDNFTRVTQDTIKNVVFKTLDIKKFNDTNDNIIHSTINFDVLILIQTN